MANLRACNRLETCRADLCPELSVLVCVRLVSQDGRVFSRPNFDHRHHIGFLAVG